MKSAFHSVKVTVVATLVGGGLCFAPTLFAASPAQVPQSMNVIKFGDAGTLFVGDSKSATLYAYSVKANSNPDAAKGFNLHNAGSRLAEFAKVPLKDVLIRDMAIHPTSKEAYIAFDVKRKNGYASRLVTVNQAGGIKAVDLAKTAHTSVQFSDAPTADVTFWDKTPMRTFTFTDIDLHKGKVYVSGMSNAEFSSALRVVDYPFNKQKASTTSVEIFHAVHGQKETRAPIQTMSIVTLEDGDYILAAYTCTPLVLIPLKDLKDGAHISGKTIAELGYGNTPIDMIQFASQDFEKNGYRGIILSNRNRSAQFVNLKDVAASSKTDSIGYAGISEHAGTPATKLPMTGLMQLEDQDDYRIATLRRNDETGDIELISFMKNAYLRLDEFVAEYDMPSYQYAGQQLQSKAFQNMLIQDSGLTKFLKP